MANNSKKLTKEIKAMTNFEKRLQDKITSKPSPQVEREIFELMIHYVHIHVSARLSKGEEELSSSQLVRVGADALVDSIHFYNLACGKNFYAYSTECIRNRIDRELYLSGTSQNICFQNIKAPSKVQATSLESMYNSINPSEDSSEKHLEKWFRFKSKSNNDTQSNTIQTNSTQNPVQTINNGNSVSNEVLFKHPLITWAFKHTQRKESLKPTSKKPDAVPFEFLLDTNEKKQLENLVECFSKLSTRQYCYIFARFGLHREPAKSNQETANLLDISANDAALIENQIFKKIENAMQLNQNHLVK